MKYQIPSYIHRQKKRKTCTICARRTSYWMNLPKEWVPIRMVGPDPLGAGFIRKKNRTFCGICW